MAWRPIVRAGASRPSACGKINGAVGKYSAHLAAYRATTGGVRRAFVESLGLEFNP